MRTIAVTSGKGGVGKTNISANVGLALAQKGKRVVIFDADLGLANLDVVLGTKAQYALHDCLGGEKKLVEIVTHGPGGIQFIAGGSGVEALVNLNSTQLERFLTELQDFSQFTDIMIFDTGAGIDQTVMAFLQASDETLLVITPDPASITDAYATAKLLFSHKPEAVVRVVLNQVFDEAQARAVYSKVNGIAQQFLGKHLIFGGYIRHDLRALQCIRKRQPYVIGDPLAPASQDVFSVAAGLLGHEHTPEREGFVNRLRNVFSFGWKKSA
ncbi:MAG: MinD/ParA family protein [Fimbriimonadaceae bacterium]